MTAFSAEDLARHANSLRAIARDLLGEGLAEDAVQDACVAALVRPPAGPVVAAAWLRRVVRNCAIDLRRSEQRRRRREQMVACSEAGEEADPAERLELQQEILAAVRSLDVAYRTAIWMRYYEHRSPGAIAAALGEPVKTVKTRLWRALQLLRQKLDHRYGDRRAWFGALAPLAKLSGRASGVGAAVAAGALWMQAKPLLIATILGLALIAGGAWIWSGGGAPPSPLQSLSEVKAHGDPQPVADAGQTRRVAEVEAGAAKSPADVASAYGSLVVRVRWHDGTPAAGIAIYCDVEGEPQIDRNELCIVSDHAGLARAARVHAGKVRLSSERGGRMDVQTVADTQREVDFVLSRGIDVTGFVRDERQLPVGGAQVFLLSPRSGWLSGRVVASTDASGAFAVRAVDPKWSLGARAPGYAPSALVDLEDVERPADAVSIQVQFRLSEPGASVAGTVVDETGAGIAAAVVVVGRGGGAEYEFDGFKHSRTRERWCPQVVSTGRDGRFRCEGVQPGLQEIVAWGEGCTRVQDSVQCVAGQTASITLTLARGVTVSGTVRNAAGEVVGDALVVALTELRGEESINTMIPYNNDDRRPHTRSDAEGRFLLRGVPAGELHLAAAKRRTDKRGQFRWSLEGYCLATLAGGPGEQVRWDPVLVAGKTIRVRVVDAEGKPVDEMRGVSAYAEQPAGVAATPVSDQESPGVYLFTDCADVPYSLLARWDRFGSEPRWAYRTGVMPGGPEVELRFSALPPLGELGDITGRIVDLGHRLAGKALSVRLWSGGSSLTLTVVDDRFQAKEVMPGRYFIRASANQDVVLTGPWFELQSGQHLDLGDLNTGPGASIRVALRAPDGADLGKPAATLFPEWRHLQWDGTQLVADNVTTGRYRLMLKTPGWHATPRDVELVAGKDNDVTLDVVPGTLRKFIFAMPLPEQWQRCDFTLRNTAGNVVSDHLGITSSRGPVQPDQWWEVLPFGEFTLEAMLDGQRHTWPVDLRDPATGDRPLRFSLR